MDSVKFDSLLFVKQKHVEDLSIGVWFKLRENPSFGQINLAKYLIGHTSNSNEASTYNKKLVNVTKETDDPGPEKAEEGG